MQDQNVRCVGVVFSFVAAKKASSCFNNKQCATPMRSWARQGASRIDRNFKNNFVKGKKIPLTSLRKIAKLLSKERKMLRLLTSIGRIG